MKMIILLSLLIGSFSLAQDISIGFNYSGLLSSKNYESIDIYTIETDAEIISNTLNAGITISLFKGEILNSKTINPTPYKYIYEDTFKFGFSSKYYFYNYRNNYFGINTYFGLEFGSYLNSDFRSVRSQMISCEEDIRYEKTKDFYAILSLGSILFPEESINIILALQYQFRSLLLKYEIPACEPPYISSNFEETVNLNALLFNVGFRINI
jgi:hypothetical protein